MRIAHIITRFINGGADENTLLSCNWFAEQGNDVFLIYGRDCSTEIIAKVHENVKIIQVPCLVREISPLRDILAFLQICRILRRCDLDIVHTHTSKAGLIGRMAASLSSRAAVVHGIHILPFIGVGRLAGAVYVFAERVASLVTDVFVSVSKGMRDQALLRGIGDESNHEVIMSGMDVDYFRLATGREGRGEHLNVLYLAGFEARKQHRELISAISRRAADLERIRFLMYGAGDEVGSIRASVHSLGLQELVHVGGYASDPASVIAQADVGIYCSTNEGLPRAVVQYCIAGRPVIAFDLPGLGALVGSDNGFVHRQGDFDGLLDSIVQLRNNPGLIGRLASGSSSRDVSAWSGENMCRALDAVYRKALR